MPLSTSGAVFLLSFRGRCPFGHCLAWSCHASALEGRGAARVGSVGCRLSLTAGGTVKQSGERSRGRWRRCLADLDPPHICVSTIPLAAHASPQRTRGTAPAWFLSGQVDAEIQCQREAPTRGNNRGRLEPESNQTTDMGGGQELRRLGQRSRGCFLILRRPGVDRGDGSSLAGHKPQRPRGTSSNTPISLNPAVVARARSALELVPINLSAMGDGTERGSTKSGTTIPLPRRHPTKRAAERRAPNRATTSTGNLPVEDGLCIVYSHHSMRPLRRAPPFRPIPHHIRRPQPSSPHSARSAAAAPTAGGAHSGRARRRIPGYSMTSTWEGSVSAARVWTSVRGMYGRTIHPTRAHPRPRRSGPASVVDPWLFSLKVLRCDRRPPPVSWRRSGKLLVVAWPLLIL